MQFSSNPLNLKLARSKNQGLRVGTVDCTRRIAFNTWPQIYLQCFPKVFQKEPVVNFSVVFVEEGAWYRLIIFGTSPCFITFQIFDPLFMVSESALPL